MAQKALGVGAGDIHRLHVGDVEDPCPAAHRMVLLDLGAIVQRHVPAAEGDDPGTQALVLGI